MKLPAIRIAALSLTLLLSAQAQTTFTDPANLRGERVSPKTGRELPIDQGALGLQQLLRKLNTRASLMLIVAHPDDEDGGMLTLYSRGLGARVATLTLTRGEGGQNAMTGDFEDALGLIRTQELLAADRYFGADQLFGTEVDFGFSKTKEEAFRKWTHERVLYDAVRAVRLYRPLVIAAVFVGGVTDGHGQHQVSGEIAQEVFKAAADPKVFPELTAEGILPWAPLKVYARVPGFAITDKGLFDYATNQYVPASFTNYVTGQTTTTAPAADVVIHEGKLDPLLTDAAANPADLREPNPNPATQLSYVQFARIGLGLQRTQIGPGVRLASPGAYDIGYHRYGSRLPNQPKAEQSFFDGIDTSIESLASYIPSAPREITGQISALASEIRQVVTWSTGNESQRAGLSVLIADTLNRDNALLSMLDKANMPLEAKATVVHELRVKQVQLNDSLILALGIQYDAQADGSDKGAFRAGSPVPVRSTLTMTTAPTGPPDVPPPAVQFVSEHLQNDRQTGQFLSVEQQPPNAAKGALRQSIPVVHEQTPSLPNSPTRPYFRRQDAEHPVYDLIRPALRNAPQTPYALTAWATLHYGGGGSSVDLAVGHVVHTSDQPLRFVPPATVAFQAHAQVVPDDSKSTVAGLQFEPPGTKVHAIASRGWAVKSRDFSAQGGGTTEMLELQPPAGRRQPATVSVSATLPDSSVARDGFRTVGYPSIPYTDLYTPADLRIVPVDLKLPTHRRIAYLPGTGDAVADNLRSIGFDVANLTVSDLTPEHLSHFDTVILGVRTYNAHPDLHGTPTQALLAFARNGGNVIVQYQTAEFTAADAPYPLTLGNAEKVVDETTPVRLLDPTAPALLYPNRITAADFNDWIEERGHGFLHTWDPHYTALTETHDPGAPAEHIAPQLPQEGGLIVTPLGKGHWTYVAFALYRQLPEAVPGAFRLFANLLALADAKP